MKLIEFFKVFTWENMNPLFLKLKKNNIYVRRYFYPLISQFPTYRGLESAKATNLPVAEKKTKEVICLPIYAKLDKDSLEFITKIIRYE